MTKFIKVKTLGSVTSFKDGQETTSTVIDDQILNIDHISQIFLPAGFVYLNDMPDRLNVTKKSLKDLVEAIQPYTVKGVPSETS